MRKSTLSLTAGAMLALTLLAPRPAAAQPFTLCVAGLSSACLGVQLFQDALASAVGTRLTVRFQNLQGSYGASGGDLFSVRALLIATDGIPLRGASGPRTGFGLIGGAAAVPYTQDGVPVEAPDVGGWDGDFNVYTMSLNGERVSYLWNYLGMPPKIVGCVLPPMSSGGVRDPYIQTCPATQGDAWAEVWAKTPELDPGMPFGVSFFYSYGSTDGRCGLEASVQNGAATVLGTTGCDLFPYAGITHAPEPATLALLGTGLLALGGVAMRRRR